MMEQGAASLRGAMDSSKKTMRHFYCRDALWECFEQMANDFDCSIDYLINESMKTYARSKNYEVAGASSPSVPQLPPPPPPPAPRMRALTPPPAPLTPAASTKRPSLQSDFKLELTPPPADEAAPPLPPLARQMAPRVMDAPAPVFNSAPLYVMFNGEKLVVDKDQFIIGRGSKSCDLTIKDGNISRKHAAVIRRNGVFYIKDLGSTNGIDYKGMRIDNKRIDEGDVFLICDYELKFTYIK